MTDVKVAIVGASAAKWPDSQRGTPELVKDKIMGILKSYDSPVLISGACPYGGVDIWAEEVADSQNLRKWIFPPEQKEWKSYRKRNIQIAETCDVLYDIVPFKEFAFCHHHQARDHDTSGGCWTMLRAGEMGKEAILVVLEV